MSILESDFELLRRNADAARAKSDFARLAQQARDLLIITRAQQRTFTELLVQSHATVQDSRALMIAVARSES